LSKIEKPGMILVHKTKTMQACSVRRFLLLKINLFIFIYVFISLLIYTQVNPNKGGKPTGYRTSLSESNVDTKQLRERVTLHTLLQIFVKLRSNFECMTRYIKVGKQNTKTYNNYSLIKTLKEIRYRSIILIINK
jgi:hypothetical protein